jgi:hypothetical protein
VNNREASYWSGDNVNKSSDLEKIAHEVNSSRLGKSAGMTRR